MFIDGTWLYYSMVKGRGVAMNCPMQRKFGPHWSRTHFADWRQLPQVIGSSIQEQLWMQLGLEQARGVEVVRVSVFTSMRSDTVVGGDRDTMVADFYRANFDVHRLAGSYRCAVCAAWRSCSP